MTRPWLFLLLMACSGDEKTTTRDTVPECVDLDGDGITDCDGDCNDADATIHPGATDLVGDGIDSDCDGLAPTSPDDTGADDTGDVDRDLDGYPQSEDCDDTNGAIHPSADEHCDGVDNDCDSYVDEASIDAPPWYADTDGDGYGDAEVWVTTCEAPEGMVLDSTDCDDGVATINPGGTEVCDDADTDEDCDGFTDDGDDSVAYNRDVDIVYLDRDGDGFGAGATLTACDAIAGSTSLVATDCDDTDVEVFPDSTEYCDGEDDNCDGEIDEDTAVDASTWYTDADGDAFGEVTSFTIACNQPEGMVLDATDCDDGDATTYVGAMEWCDDTDSDCGAEEDDDHDPDTLDPTDWYPDVDGDTYGDPAGPTVSACVAPSGMVADYTDCDDSVDGINPAVTEVCDDADTDEDCDGLIDDEDGSVAAGSLNTWYNDADEDGFASPYDTTKRCDPLDDYTFSSVTATDKDCDDHDPDINPDAKEVCDYVDNNCDGKKDNDASDADTWYRDSDGDGYGDAGTLTTSCTEPSGYTSNSKDCDDTDAAINPGEFERCSTTSTDDDCDGDLEKGAIDGATWYKDADRDGYGNPSSSKWGCTPSGYVSDNMDCDDSASGTNPGANEVCDSSNEDEDCDGAADDDDTSATGKTKYYTDADGDHYGISTDYIKRCDTPTSGSYSTKSTDCDDGSDLIYPGGDDSICNGLDDNCGNVVDVESGFPSPCEGGTYDCQEVYTSKTGHTYLFCASKQNWDTADGFCRGAGYHLVSIDDSDEEDWLSGEIEGLPGWGSSTRVWTGLRDDFLERWASQESMEERVGYGYCPEASLSYDNWLSGEPNSTSEDCGEFKMSSGAWGWNDLSCVTSEYFVCESCDPL